MTITLQPSPIVDSIRDDGTELTRLPYPFHVNEDGLIGRQDFWRGKVFRVIGFATDLDVHRVDLTWSDVVADPQRAVGTYLVTADADDNWSTHLNAISKVRAS